MNIAKTALLSGNDNEAILSYNEVAGIFAKYKKFDKLGICYNNMGCIYLKNKDFYKE
jgi:hypothetical protein